MSRFIAKPFEIEAIQWFKNGDHPNDAVEIIVDKGSGQEIETEGKLVRRFRHPGVPGIDACPRCQATWDMHGWIDRGTHGYTVHVGDWIVWNGKNHFPVLGSVFLNLYAPIEDKLEIIKLEVEDVPASALPKA